jgi:hypothetical protein
MNLITPSPDITGERTSGTRFLSIAVLRVKLEGKCIV